jgi:nucleoside-diphosphate-sugar epimerase
MKVLFLGGAGNISSACAAALAKQGHEIIVVGRGRSPVPPEYRFLCADRKDAGAVRELTRDTRPEVVINFLGYEVADVQLDYDVFRGVAQQYIFISSATVYAKPPPRLPLTEDGPFGNPWWEYARKKLACEEWLRECRAGTGFPVTIVRPSHTYSERWIPNPVSSSSYSFAARLEKGEPVFVHDDGETLWTLTASSDFAAGLSGLIGNAEAIGESFHITSDEVLTWNRIVSEIAAALGASAPQIVHVPTDFICQVAPHLTGTLKGDKAHPGVFDNSKIKKFVPGFGCRKTLESGIRQSVAWLRGHPEQQNLNPQVDTTCEQVITAWLGGKPFKP